MFYYTSDILYINSVKFEGEKSAGGMNKQKLINTILKGNKRQILDEQNGKCLYCKVRKKQSVFTWAARVFAGILSEALIGQGIKNTDYSLIG